MKPWLKLATTKVSFTPGFFETDNELAGIHLLKVDRNSVKLGIGEEYSRDDITSQYFSKDDLTQFIDFLTELRDSLG